MPKQIRMPKLSDTMEEGTLLAWRKSVGDKIERGDILAEIETDKADMEFESYTEGVIHALAVEPGATVPIGTLIAIVRLAGDSDADMEASLKDADQSLLLDKSLTLAHLTRAEALQATGKISEGINAAGKAVEYSYRFPEAYLVRARRR